jgi:hypothetical protein
MLESRNAFHISLLAVNQLELTGQNEYRMNPSFRALLAAINQGWQVEEPVHVLPSVRTQTWIYYFTLTNKVFDQSSQVFVPAVPEVERFVERNQFQVIEGSFY